MGCEHEGHGICTYACKNGPVHFSIVAAKTSIKTTALLSRVRTNYSIWRKTYRKSISSEVTRHVGERNVTSSPLHCISFVHQSLFLCVPGSAGKAHASQNIRRDKKCRLLD